MDIFNKLKEEVAKILEEMKAEQLLPEDCAFAGLTAEPPRDAAHGDIATNAAMVVAKKAGKKPRDLAEMIATRIETLDWVVAAEVAGPGFINVRLGLLVWQQVLDEILLSGVGYGNSQLGDGKNVNIEYVSANPTGPLHIGHARGAVYGDALALLLLKVGYQVTKEYYINDAGSQIDILARSAFLRYREALGDDIGEIPQGLYPGEYLKVVGASLAEKYTNTLQHQHESDWLPVVRKFAVETMMTLIKNDLSKMGIVHDVFTSEKQLQDNGKIEEAIDLLQGKGLLYEGVLEPPKGKKPDDWEPREQTLFRATDFGDDVDRALKKSDGSYTYFASDVAYHLDKYRRGFNQMVLILGADHGGYVKRLSAAVNALSDGKATVDCKISQLVNFLDGGKPVKMSKRAGSFATVRDVIDAVGGDVVRFIMMTRKNDVVLDFDLAAVTEQSKDNPVFYVQYAHARARSVLRAAVAEAPEAYAAYKERQTGDLSLCEPLKTPDELALIKRMAAWPRAVEAAALANEPHRVAFYLQELAAEFHALWNKGKDDAVLRFIVKDNKELTAARLAMLKAMTQVIASGLFIFSIEPVEEMR